MDSAQAAFHSGLRDAMEKYREKQVIRSGGILHSLRIIYAQTWNHPTLWQRRAKTRFPHQRQLEPRGPTATSEIVLAYISYRAADGRVSL